MKKFRRLYYRYFKHYRILERALADYGEADKLIKDSNAWLEKDRWVLDTAIEDYNVNIGMVYLCRRERIWE